MDRDVLDEDVITGDGVPLKDQHPMQNTAEYKEYRRLWELATKREIMTDFPLHIDIELTSTCNLKCSMCWQSGSLIYPKGFMKMDLFKKIIDEGVENGMRAIKLQSRGESMMHPQILEAIRYAKDKGVLDIQLTTNATLLKPEKFDSLLDSGIDVLIFSIDVAHKESYEQLHPGKKYADIVETIVAFLNRRKERGLKYPFVRVQAVKVGGADLNPHVQSILNRIMDLVDRIEVGELFTLVDESQQIDKSKFELLPCPYLWQRMVANYDGKITMCCRDYNCEHVLGDANKQTIKAIWNGPVYTKSRELHSKMQRDLIKVCAHCNLYIRERKPTVEIPVQMNK